MLSFITAHCTSGAEHITLLIGAHNIKASKEEEPNRIVVNVTKENIFTHPKVYIIHLYIYFFIFFIFIYIYIYIYFLNIFFIQSTIWTASLTTFQSFVSPRNSHMHPTSVQFAFQTGNMWPRHLTKR